MSPDPEDDPSPDDSNPPPPPDDSNPPPPPADNKRPPPPADETPPSDEASRINRLHSLWRKWAAIQGLLRCMARSSDLPPTDGELAADEVLDRLIAVTVSDDPPDYPFALARVAMRRLLGRIRECGCASIISESSKHASPHHLDASSPGIKEFWEWVQQNAQTIESQLTALQWQTLMATKDARTIDSAASRCSQLPINYRNTTQRLGKKLSKRIKDGSVPPPLLMSVRTMVSSSTES